MKRCLGVIAIGIAGLWAQVQPAGAVELHLVPDSSRVEYFITHTMSDVTDFAGPAAGMVDIDVETATVHAARVEVDLRGLRTGIDKRDAHIHSHEYLDTARFPTAVFVFAAALAGDAPATVRVRGTLALHGVEREVEIPLQLAPRAGALHVRGRFTIALADHGIKRPKVLLLSAGKTVEVRLDLLFAP